MNGAHLGKLMAAGGLVIAALGGVLWALSVWAPGFRLGRLPGDIVVEKPGFGLYIPVTTMLLLSGAASLVLWLVRR